MKLLTLAIVIGLLAGAVAFAAGPTSTNTAASKSALDTVIIVYKTHFDIGYTSTAKEVVHDYRTEMTDRLLDAIEENKKQAAERQFVWTLSGYPSMKTTARDGEEPARWGIYHREQE